MDEPTKIAGIDTDTLKRIKKSLEFDPATLKAMEKIKKSLEIDPSTLKAMESIRNSMPKIPAFDLPKISMPNIAMDNYNSLKMYSPPTHEEVNEYQSASSLMESLSDEALLWKEKLPNSHRPTIKAILNNGFHIDVHSLAQVSFHGIRIEGTMNGAACVLLAHQNTVQMLCYAEEITEETPKRPIGFVWPGHNIEV